MQGQRQRGFTNSGWRGGADQSAKQVETTVHPAALAALPEALTMFRLTGMCAGLTIKFGAPMNVLGEVKSRAA